MNFVALILIALSSTAAALGFDDRPRGSTDLHLTAATPEKKKIAIVGAGVAGCTSAYFLRQLLSDHVDITVYEKEGHAGGRVTHIDVGGSRFELGGTVIHSSNAHMVNLTRDVGMHLSPSEDSGSVGIWDGQEFVFTWSSTVSVVKAYWRYGWSPYTIRSLVTDTVDRFVKIYRKQMDDRQHFNSPADLLQAVEVFNLTQISAYEYLNRMFIGDLYVREFVDPVSRINYGQNGSLNAFVDLVSLAGASITGTCHSIQEGNENVLVRALDKSRAQVKLRTAVHQIKLVNNACIADEICPQKQKKNRPRYEVRSDRGVEVFDAVVIAAPLEFANINMKGFDIPANAKAKRAYQTTHTTFVAGHLNATYFNTTKESSLPSTIATIESETIPFSSISNVGKTIDGINVYKIFSRTKPTTTLLDVLFSERVETHYKEWQAYPVLKPADSKNWPPFWLDTKSGGYGVYNVNAMETSVSCMETEAIGAKNVALAVCAALQESERCTKM